MMKFTGRTSLFAMGMYATGELKPDTTDVAWKVDNADGEPTIEGNVSVSNGYIGAQFRTDYNYIRSLSVRDCASDLAIAWGSYLSIGHLKLDITNPYTYTRQNHKDGMQFINMNPRTFKREDTPVTDIEIFQMTAKVTQDDIFLLHFTETCGYENVKLFERGVDVEVENSNAKYLVDTTNAVDWVIGSKNNPVDADRICDLAIRIRGAKDGSKSSKNIVIHARSNVTLELDKSAEKALKLFTYL